MGVDISRKRDFLAWLMESVEFQRREVYWIINYLLNHEVILRETHFVENVSETPRGLKFVASNCSDTESLALYINGKAFTNPEQIFHDIRMKWRDPLYIECDFNDSWGNTLFLSTVEDNPYATWNDVLDEQLVSTINQYIDEIEKKNAVTELYHAIDEALESNDLERFNELSERLNTQLAIQEKEHSSHKESSSN